MKSVVTSPRIGSTKELHKTYMNVYHYNLQYEWVAKENDIFTTDVSSTVCLRC